MTNNALLRTLALLLAAFVIGGCASTPKKPRPPAARSGPTPEQFAEAFDLASKAQRSQENDKPDVAIAQYRQSLAIYREFPAAWNNLGVVLMQESRYLEAGECFAAAAELAPRDPRPMYNLGLTWDRAGYLEEALTQYLRSVERDGRYLPALRGAIRAERLLGKGDLATLDRLKSALLLEQDPRWRDWLELQRLRIEAEQDAQVGANPASS